jgi:hypothetical protein
MRIVFDPTEEVQVRVKYNGTVVYDKKLQPGHQDIDIDHPKDSGLVEAFLVEPDGTEVPIGSADYGTPSEQPSGQ